MQNTSIRYSYFSTDKITRIYTGWRIDYASYRYCRQDTLWMLLHSATQSRNIQTEFSKTRIDGAAITPQENRSSDDRRMRIVLLLWTKLETYVIKLE